MLPDLARRATPEEQEVAKKREELAALGTQLAQRELELATLQVDLTTVEMQYLQLVGARYAELDEIRAQIAELYARLRPTAPQVQQQAVQARAQAQESAQAARPAPSEQSIANPPESLKKLYRQLARMLHPDLTTDPQERERRTRFMAAVNAAYKAGDETRLQDILREWENSPDSVIGTDIGADLIRLIRQIAQVHERLEAIDAEIEALQESDLYRLRVRIEKAASEGRDLLREMEQQVIGEIDALLTRLAQLIDGEQS